MKCVKAVVPDNFLHLKMIQQMLEGNGIPSVVHGEHLLNMRLNYYSGEAGLQLFVLSDGDFDRAKSLIQKFEGENYNENSEKEDYGENKKRKWILRIGKFFVLVYLLFMFLGGVFMQLAQFIFHG